jgi:putative ABC transport system permease protein
MPDYRFLRVGWRFAWKDLRARFWKSAALVIALAISVAGISGVRGAAKIASDALHSGSRASLAGDVCVDMNEFLTERQVNALNALRAGGVQWTLVTMFLTMASSEETADPTFAAIKVVDPAVYPFYGRRNLTPMLQGDNVIVSEETLSLLHVRVGDSILIAHRKFRISAVGQAEPEQIMGILSRGVRCVLSRENYEKTGLGRSGNSMRNRVLIRLPRSFALRAARQRLQNLFPSGVVVDYRDVNRNTGVRLEAASTFVTEIALLALVLGAIGLALAIRQYIELRMASFAVMKMVGARSRHLIAAFVFGTALILVAALPLGILLGWIVKNSLLSIASKYYVLPPENGGRIYLLMDVPLAAGLAILPAIARPIWLLSRLSPAAILRDNVQPVKSRVQTWLWLSPIPCLAVFLEIVYRFLGSWNATFEFTGALVSATALCIVLAMFLTGALSRLRNVPPAVRLALANLNRPGRRAVLLTAAISVGAMMMIATLESGEAIIRAVSAKLPWNLSNSILIAGFAGSHREPILEFLRAIPGVTEVEAKTEVRIRLTAAEGVENDRVTGWYLAGCSSRGLILDDDLQHRLGAKIGSRLHFIAGNRQFWETVAAISSESAAPPLQIDCSDVDTDLSNQAIVHARPDRLPAIGEAIRGQFPTLPVVTASEIVAVVEQISRDAQFLARIVAWYFVMAGLCILMALVASSRAERAHEMGILSALGASPKVLGKVFTVEFASIGAIGGVLGSLLSSWLSLILIKLAFERWEFVFQWRIMAAAVFSSAVLTAIAGWIPAYPLLRRKPMMVLRRE